VNTNKLSSTPSSYANSERIPKVSAAHPENALPVDKNRTINKTEKTARAENVK